MKDLGWNPFGAEGGPSDVAAPTNAEKGPAPEAARRAELAELRRLLNELAASVALRLTDLEAQVEDLAGVVPRRLDRRDGDERQALEAGCTHVCPLSGDLFAEGDGPGSVRRGRRGGHAGSGAN